MALTACPDCGTKVSDRAVNCTNCGHSMLDDLVKKYSVRHPDILSTENADKVKDGGQRTKFRQDLGSGICLIVISGAIPIGMTTSATTAIVWLGIGLTLGCWIRYF